MAAECICRVDAARAHPDCTAHPKAVELSPPRYTLIEYGTDQYLGICVAHAFPVVDECPTCIVNSELAWEARSANF